MGIVEPWRYNPSIRERVYLESHSLSNIKSIDIVDNKTDSTLVIEPYLLDVSIADRQLLLPHIQRREYMVLEI
jgi:hypothetical protein